MSSRRTKIIATLGPAQDSPGSLERLLDAGVDVLRVNLSHASPRQQAARVKRARAHRPDVAVLVDLCGPKLRLGELPAEIDIGEGDTVVLGAGGVPVADPTLYARVQPGDPVYIADGTISLEVTAAASDRVTCRVRVGGRLRSRKGINLPRDASSLPVVTEKDRADLAEVGLLDPDFVAVSYVRHEDDLADVRRLTDLPLVAKIEKQQALERIDAILAAADAVMVARGDLGVEIPIERVPAAQKRLIHAANRMGKPVITATQMLMSMVSSPLPTRAEVTDVANAVLDGTDCVMLSEETAVGHDPVAAVDMMSRLLAETEPLLPSHEGPTHAEEGNALAAAAARLAEDLDADAIVAPTRTGLSALRLSAFRPRRPILAYSRVPATTRRLRLAWGVEAVDLTVPAGVDPLTATLEAARRYLRPGARVVVLDIAPPGARGVASLVNAITF
ncbi:MAG TPA: pyruvate kinase [Polyangia bacterium]|jgi:pyruvate kinase|nr:pyruvate kinase [Polyangia bacterium]